MEEKREAGAYQKMNRTKIEYLHYTTNPIIGCSGKGCAIGKNCWARKQARRHKNECELCGTFEPHIHWTRFDDFLSVKKPSRIGVSFMGEFYDDKISNWVRKDYYMHMLSAPQHTFIIFTKQPQNIDDDPLPENLWIGVSVNCKKDLWRLDVLRQIETDCRIASFEPLYEDLGEVNLKDIGWAIIGAQTRPNLQPDPDWIAGLMLQCRTFNIPIFMKNNLQGWSSLLKEYPKKGGT